MSDTAVRPKDQCVSAFTDTLFDVPEIRRNGGQQSKHLNDLRDAVVKSAQSEGYAVGLAQGHSEGFSVGVAEGHAQAMIIAEKERTKMLGAFKAARAQRGAIDQARAAILYLVR